MPDHPEIIHMEIVAETVAALVHWLEELSPTAQLLSPRDGSTIVVPNAHVAARILRTALLPPAGHA